METPEQHAFISSLLAFIPSAWKNCNRCCSVMVSSLFDPILLGVFEVVVEVGKMEVVDILLFCVPRVKFAGVMCALAVVLA